MFYWFLWSRNIVPLFILAMYFTPLFAAPELVHPVIRRKDEKQAVYSKKELDGTHHSEYLKALQFRRAFFEYRNRQKENQILVAPIEGLRVYTMDKYIGVDNQTAQNPKFFVDSDKTKSKNEIGSRIMGVPIQKPHHHTGQSKSGQSTIFELNIDDISQASVKELEDFNGLKPVLENQSKTLSLKLPRFNFGTGSKNQTNGAKSVMSFIPRQYESEIKSVQKIRFPADSWQIPPNLVSNRHSNIVDRRPSFYNTRQNVFEETSKGYYLTTDTPPPNPVASIKMNNEVNFGPRQTYSEKENTFKIPNTKTHATFAKHNDRVVPIPLPNEGATFQETDMDLLGHTTRSFLQTLITTTLSPFPAPIEPIVGTQQPALRQQLYSRLTPNEKLGLCCKKQGLNYGCQNLCNFDNFSDKTLVAAFLTNQCPGPQLGQAFDCASTQVDHSECCIRSNVNFFNGGQCMLFCRSEKPANVFSYLGCLPVIEVIKQCYREYQMTHPNLFGD